MRLKHAIVYELVGDDGGGCDGLKFGISHLRFSPLLSGKFQDATILGHAPRVSERIAEGIEQPAAVEAMSGAHHGCAIDRRDTWGCFAHCRSFPARDSVTA
jgi:hypothetical protein